MALGEGKIQLIDLLGLAQLADKRDWNRPKNEQDEYAKSRMIQEQADQSHYQSEMLKEQLAGMQKSGTKAYPTFTSQEPNTFTQYTSPGIKGSGTMRTPMEQVPGYMSNVPQADVWKEYMANVRAWMAAAGDSSKQDNIFSR